MPSARSQVWAVVIAGGAGEPTRLVNTLGRVALEIPADRTVVVTMRSDARHFTGRRGRGESFLVQPDDRGTAASILLPIHWIGRRDPDAVVAVLPSDHVVSDESQFMAQVARVAAWVRRNPRRMVLLGAPATSAEHDRGWIEPGPRSRAPTTSPWCRGSGTSRRASKRRRASRRAVSGTRTCWSGR